MFRWPLVSRHAYDVLERTHQFVLDEYTRAREDRDRLMVQITTLTEQLVRIQRFAVGMTEAPREPRKVDPMPERVKQLIMAVGDSRIRAVQTRGAWRRYAELGSWEAVEDELTVPQNGDSDE